MKTVDSVEGALWLASQSLNIVGYFISEQLTSFSLRRMNCLHPWQAKKLSRLTKKQSLKTQRKANKFGLAVFKG